MIGHVNMYPLKHVPLGFENRGTLSDYFMMDWTRPVRNCYSKVLPKSPQGTVCSKGTGSHL